MISAISREICNLATCDQIHSMKKRFSICSNGYGFRWFSSKMGYISID
ncbi:hypothetical protein T4B_6007 [Trichinella pseudospiralis]|uniref:Uncharacterized protein n=1 Tax=Trichinella pseudospiralis TaxID=6337 RepID=A0A0V1DSZ4_TRIPS|nr:hypothetical protein T4A_9341 [Trichinella pseudospiralis]KRY64903.1 hypothetical protein T4A_592 [Trichinella pseudospiralis]KRZ02641.1 hypothetical protein T4B_6007 [Trichinella pseudospiralis]